ncbi:unnamed protein product [Didymodactylos carnosus]|uniref:Uncharacterized protein n=1 Tax=Didymodactylos carnosus TaxID=1234261 RepID=A0A8S2GRB3_9BILA|nr:unnamed protein product [Didymodactylos carnosus]CAF3551151.1 unnamed protein product [Didymodactylos carnosus]
MKNELFWIFFGFFEEELPKLELESETGAKEEQGHILLKAKMVFSYSTVVNPPDPDDIQREPAVGQAKFDYTQEEQQDQVEFNPEEELKQEHEVKFFEEELPKLELESETGAKEEQEHILLKAKMVFSYSTVVNPPERYNYKHNKKINAIRDVYDNNTWLTDFHIYLFFELLHKQFPNTNGLSPLKILRINERLKMRIQYTLQFGAYNKMRSIESSLTFAQTIETFHKLSRCKRPKLYIIQYYHDTTKDWIDWEAESWSLFRNSATLSSSSQKPLVLKLRYQLKNYTQLSTNSHSDFHTDDEDTVISDVQLEPSRQQRPLNVFTHDVRFFVDARKFHVLVTPVFKSFYPSCVEEQALLHREQNLAFKPIVDIPNSWRVGVSPATTIRTRTTTTSAAATQRRLRSTYNHFEIVFLLPSDIHISINNELPKETYHEPLECISSLTTKINKKIFFILSDTFDVKNLLPLIHNLKQITAIYLFQSKRDDDDDEQWYRNYPKLSDVAKNPIQLSSKLLQDISTVSSSSINERLTPHFHKIVEPYTIIFNKFKNIKNLSLTTLTNIEDQQFIWFQFLIESIQHLPKKDNDDIDGLKICWSTTTSENNEYKQAINRFQNTCTSNNTAILAYPRYIIADINHAFRSNNISNIYSHRYIIADIYKQIQDSSVHIGNRYKLYNGQQQIQTEELKHLKNNIGKLLCITTFMSVISSSDSARENINNDGNEPVLFEIQIDIYDHPKPFANITNYVSFGNDNETEYLFQIGTIFLLESIEQLPSEIWYIKLQLTDKEIDDSKILLDLFKNDFGDKITLWTCGMFWANVNKCEKALNYYNKLLKNSLLSNNQKITIFNNLALIYGQNKEFKKSRDCFTQALELPEHSASSSDSNTTIETNGVILKQAITDDSTLFTVCYNLGCSIYEQAEQKNEEKNTLDVKKRYRNALEKFQQAFELIKSSNQTIKIANLYNNIGCVHYRLEHYDKALDSFRQALNEGLQLSSDNQSIIVEDYLHNISLVVRRQKLEK